MDAVTLKLDTTVASEHSTSILRGDDPPQERPLIRYDLIAFYVEQYSHNTEITARGRGGNPDLLMFMEGGAEGFCWGLLLYLLLIKRGEVEI